MLSLGVREKDTSLWILAAPLTLWAIHFLLCYVSAAIWCEKMAPADGSLGTARLAIFGYTIAALAGVLWLGYLGLRAHRLDGAALPHDADSPEDRHRFVGFATLLLSGLSAIAIVYSALAAVFIRSCG